jgi:single-strand DNA-binding protein
MRGINKSILIGNTARDVELHHTSSGKAVSGIRLAINHTVRGEEETQFHTVVCWEALAETTSTHVKKGDPLYVEGRLQYRAFQDEEGRERMMTEIVASDVQFLGRRQDGPAPTRETPGIVRVPTETDEISPDEIPF